MVFDNAGTLVERCARRFTSHLRRQHMMKRTVIGLVAAVFALGVTTAASAQTSAPATSGGTMEKKADEPGAKAEKKKAAKKTTKKQAAKAEKKMEKPAEEKK
jgi:hypothetical protein